MKPIVKLLWTEEADRNLPLPAYETPGAAGADLRANLPEVKRAAGLVLAPGARALIPTGLRAEIPPGYEMQVRPRSGLAVRHGVTVVNAPGTIDADYRGEVRIGLINLGREPFTVRRGDRIAQLVPAPVVRAALEVQGSLAPTRRGDGGFGSTGLR